MVPTENKEFSMSSIFQVFDWRILRTSTPPYEINDANLSYPTSMCICTIDEIRHAAAPQAAAQREERERELRALREEFERAEADIRNGTELELLDVAARHRFGQDHIGPSVEPGFDRVQELLGTELANAVVSGWGNLVEHGFHVTPVLGLAAGRNETCLASARSWLGPIIS